MQQQLLSCLWQSTPCIPPVVYIHCIELSETTTKAAKHKTVVNVMPLIINLLFVSSEWLMKKILHWSFFFCFTQTFIFLNFSPPFSGLCVSTGLGVVQREDQTPRWGVTISYPCILHHHHQAPHFLVLSPFVISISIAQISHNFLPTAYCNNTTKPLSQVVFSIFVVSFTQ